MDDRNEIFIPWQPKKTNINNKVFCEDQKREKKRLFSGKKKALNILRTTLNTKIIVQAK